MEVSRICLGCMSYGEPERGGHPWSLDEEASRPFIRQAVEAGINFFDTANVYSDGTSEEIIGRALADSADATRSCMATKVHGRMHRGPNGGGPVAQGDPHRDRPQPAPPGHRLRRPLPDPPLGPPHADRGDDGGAARRRQGRQGPLHRRLVDVRLAVLQGPVHRRAQRLDPFVSMQNHYNLLHREEEREMLPLCADQGVGVIPWSPLARGRLTRDWDATTARSETDEFGRTLYRESDREIVDAVAASPSGAASAGRRSPSPGSPATRGRRADRRGDQAGAPRRRRRLARRSQLTAEEVAELEAPYTPTRSRRLRLSQSTLRRRARPAGTPGSSARPCPCTSAATVTAPTSAATVDDVGDHRRRSATATRSRSSSTRSIERTASSASSAELART